MLFRRVESIFCRTDFKNKWKGCEMYEVYWLWAFAKGQITLNKLVSGLSFLRSLKKQRTIRGGCLQNPGAAVLPPGGGDSWRLPQCGNWRGEAHWASSGKEEGLWRERTHQPALQSPLCDADERKCNDAVQQMPWCHFCWGGWSRVTIIYWYIVQCSYKFS